MGNICPCPKRGAKKQFAYDVHQQTFQMDENIQNIGESSPKNQHADQDNNILTEDIRSSEDATNNLSHDEDKLVQRIVVDIPQIKQEIVGDYQASTTNELKIQAPKQLRQEIPFIQKPVEEPVKPSFQANILKPKTVKKKYNPDDYRYKDEVNSFKVKQVNSIKQQQYNIDNCKNSHYFIFDITANLYIDNTEDCTIFIAPCQSTVFIRNCKRLIVVGATKQFRTYQCHNCIFSLYCKSQPVIESSSNLQFTSFKCPNYPQLSKQFSSKRLEPWNNHWSQIFNFTKKEGQKHSSIHENIDLDIDWNRAFELANLTLETSIHPIPFIVGQLPYQPKRQLLLIFNKGVTDDIIREALIGCIILKGFQGVVIGEGKQQKKALLIDLLEVPQQRFQGIARIISDPAEISEGKNKWFISFGDEREK